MKTKVFVEGMLVKEFDHEVGLSVVKNMLSHEYPNIQDYQVEEKKERDKETGEEYWKIHFKKKITKVGVNG